MRKYIGSLVLLLIGVSGIVSRLDAKDTSTDSSGYLSSIMEYIGSIDPMYYLGWSEIDPLASMEPYSYLCFSIESGVINIENFVEKLKELKAQNYELFNTISNKIVEAGLVDDLKTKYELMHEATQNGDFSGHLLLTIIADNMRISDQTLEKENIYNVILGNCFTSKEVLKYAAWHNPQGGLTVQEVHEVVLNNLIKLSKKYEIIEQILHATAIYIKKNPDARIDFMKYDHVIAASMSGLYMLDEQKGEDKHKFVGVGLTGMNAFKKFGDHLHKGWLETFMHELTHQLMQILYQNNCRPYNEGDESRISSYHNKIAILERQLSRNKAYLHGNQKFVSTKTNDGSVIKSSQPYLINNANAVLGAVISLYDKNQCDAEYIVRLPQILSSMDECNADDPFDQDAVAALLNPLVEYWNIYIKPDIDSYLAKNSEYDNFVCLADTD